MSIIDCDKKLHFFRTEYHFAKEADTDNTSHLLEHYLYNLVHFFFNYYHHTCTLLY